MKVLITGAQGQLGRCLSDRLHESQHEAIAVSRSELDITNALEVNEIVRSINPDVIFNAAAFTAVDRAESERDAAFRVNSDAVANLANAADDVEALLVHISTDYVFDGSASQPIRESDPVIPMGVYGESKLAGEKAAAKAQRHIIVRTAWVFSEYGNNFLKTMVRLGRERDIIFVVDDQVGTPTYAGDLANALIELADVQPENGIYHFSGGRACTWYEFAGAIFEANSRVSRDFTRPSVSPIPSSEFPTPAKRPAYSVLDGRKLLEVAGISGGSWEETLESICRKITI